MAEMNDLAKKWVAALRSGEYEQGTQALRRYDQFCCLGVLCDISESGEWEDGIFEAHDGGRWGGYAPDKLFRSVLVGSTSLSIEQSTLSKVNDNGSPFTAIADEIESWWV